MKRIYFLLVVICISFLSFSQNKKLNFKKGINTEKKESLMPSRSVSESKNYIEINYNFEDADVIDIKQDTDQFQLIRVKGFGVMGDVGKPSLPFYNDILVVPQKEGMKIKILEADYKEYDNFYIQPALEPQFDSEKYPDTKIKIDKSTYSSNSYFPKDIVEIVSIQDYRDIPLAFVQTSPIQFNPKTKKIRCYSNIKYQIVFDGSKTKRKINDKIDALAILKNTVSNPESIETYTASSSTKLRSASIAESSTSRDYIIITTDEFLPAAKMFADWKTILGFSCEVVSQASWDTTQVRNAIYTRYRDWSPKPEYFLIIGDQEDVPGITYRSIANDSLYATDLLYACMDDSIDSKTPDYRPDMSHGRVSVSSFEEAYLVLRKIVNYERSPIVNDSFYKTAINCTEFIIANNFGYEERRFTLTSEEIRNYLKNLPDSLTVNRVYYSEGNTYYPNTYPQRYAWGAYANGDPIPGELRKEIFPFYPWDGNNTDIINEINSGRFCVFHRGHGRYTCWAHPYFDTTDVSNLSNGDKLPVIFSIECQAGSYLQDVCLAEKFIRHPRGGAVGVFAASEISYSGWNDALAVGLFDAIWPNPGLIANFGSGRDPTSSINQHSALYKMGNVLNQGLLRMEGTWLGRTNNLKDTTKYRLYQHKIFHYLGDPSMEMYTASPSTFSNASVTENGSSVSVNTNGVSNCKVTICSMLDMGESYYEVVENTSSCTFSNVTKPYYVSITKHNYKPYIFPQDVYIQNHTFTSDRLIVGRNIFVGDSVIASQAHGPVVIESGAHVTFSADEDVILDSGVETKIGGSLDIKKRW